jgi:hypothetical protein
MRAALVKLFKLPTLSAKFTFRDVIKTAGKPVPTVLMYRSRGTGSLQPLKTVAAENKLGGADVRRSILWLAWQPRLQGHGRQAAG